jgi:signal transduction histidine kinase
MDISSHIIATDIIRNRIGNVFPDCIVLDSKFKITAISQNILDATGYTREEVLTHSVNLFSNSSDLVGDLAKLLTLGYFTDVLFDIRRSDGEHIDYMVSGFYLGLVCDINGAVILKMNNQQEIREGRNYQDLKTAEIDKFVYTAAHSLRGPLATIKGLINVAKTYRHTSEVLFLINQLHEYSEKLDDKLHKLIYFAESDKGQEALPTGRTPLSEIITLLRKPVPGQSDGRRINFRCAAEDVDISFAEGQVVLELLRNLLHFLRQHVSDIQNTVVLDVHTSQHCTELIIRANGFMITPLVKAKLTTLNNSYSELLSNPELVHYYAAKKIVYRLRGEIQFVISGNDEVSVLLLIPNEPIPRT